MRSTVLVAGGAGFLGSHICDRLLARGHAVICIDDLSTGRIDNLAHALGSSAFRFVHADILEAQPMDICARVDCIINMASPASPKDYRLDPVRTLRINVEGTRRLLEAAVRWRARYIHASSSEVYGDPEHHPQSETYAGHVPPIGPRSCYTEGKRCAEALCNAFAGQHGASICVLRIFNVYGPRMRWDDGRVVPTFIRQALSGDDITVLGDGQQTRSFCYISDFIEAVVRIAELESFPPWQVVNIGNPEEVTVLGLAEAVVRLTGSRSRIAHAAAVPGDPRRRCPDITRIRSWLGWQPRVPLQDGLRTMIADCGGRLPSAG